MRKFKILGVTSITKSNTQMFSGLFEYTADYPTHEQTPSDR